MFSDLPDLFGYGEISQYDFYFQTSSSDACLLKFIRFPVFAAPSHIQPLCHDCDSSNNTTTTTIINNNSSSTTTSTPTIDSNNVINNTHCLGKKAAEQLESKVANHEESAVSTNGDILSSLAVGGGGLAGTGGGVRLEVCDHVQFLITEKAVEGVRRTEAADNNHLNEATGDDEDILPLCK